MTDELLITVGIILIVMFDAWRDYESSKYPDQWMKDRYWRK